MATAFDTARASFRKTMGRLGRAGLDLLFPPLCASCRVPVAEPHSLCARCWGGLSFLDGPGCRVCGYPFDYDPGGPSLCGACHAHPPAFDVAASVLRYDDRSRDLILALKRADRLDLAPAFARWMARAGRGLLSEADVVTAVPLHPTRLWRRRFNQSAELSRALARSAGRPFDPFLLSRARPTPSQGEMPSAKARRRNVLGAFRVERRDAVRGRTVLLIDDVYTTGATLEACARALKRARAAKVLVLTLARVVRSAASDI